MSKQIAFSMGPVAAEDASEVRFFPALHIPMIPQRTPRSVNLSARLAVVLCERGRIRVASAIIICGNIWETKYDG